MRWIPFSIGVIVAGVGLALLIWLIVSPRRKSNFTPVLTVSFMVFLVGFMIAYGAAFKFQFGKWSLDVKPESILDYAKAARNVTTPEQINDAIRDNPGGAIGYLKFLEDRVLIRRMLSSMYRRIDPSAPQVDHSLSSLAKRVCEGGAISTDLNKKLIRFAHDTHFAEWADAPQPDPTTLKVWQQDTPELVSDLGEQQTKLIRGEAHMIPNSACVGNIGDME